MYSTTYLATCLTFCSLLAACGGSSTGNSTTTSAPSYETLLNSTAARTSTFGGIALRSNNTSSVLDIVTTTGATTHNTGNTTISDGTYSLTDADGFDGGNSLTDGISTITKDLSSLSGTYEYVTIYGQAYTFDNDAYDSVGIGGIITSASDVPTSGSASYTGDAYGLVVTATQGFDLKNGTSTVLADFSAGTVDATMTGFTATNQATGNAASAPIDTISATGMTIAGNGFFGGTVTASNGAAVVNVSGINSTANAQGAFFGYDAAASAPDEVGGLILLQGDAGIVTGGFIAD